MRAFFAFAICSMAAVSVCFAEGPRVWVQPFTEANNQQQPDWITKTLQQSVVDELAGTKGVTLMQSATKPADAQIIVTGEIQRIDGELRVSGQVADASGNKPIGSYKATGSDRELFAIEDSIAQQIKPIVAPASAANPVAVGAAPTTQPANIQMPFAPANFGTFQGSDLELSLRNHAPLEPAPDTTGYQNPPVYNQPTPTYPTDYGLNGYNSPYGYGYGYPYWGWGGSVIVVNSDGHHHHDGNGNHNGGTPMPAPHQSGQITHTNAGFGGAHQQGIITTVTPGAPGTNNIVGPIVTQGSGGSTGHR